MTSSPSVVSVSGSSKESGVGKGKCSESPVGWVKYEQRSAREEGTSEAFVTTLFLGKGFTYAQRTESGGQRKKL